MLRSSLRRVLRKQPPSLRQLKKRRRRLLAETLEKRQLLAAGQNPIIAADVNDDGLVSPIDALAVINVLARQGGTISVDQVPPDSSFYDVNGDEQISPLDALNTINWIARDNAPPTVSVSLLNDSGQGDVFVNDLITNDPTLRIESDDFVGVRTVEVSVDSQPFTQIPIDKYGDADWDPNLPLDGTADGEINVRVRATDATGKTSPDSILRIELDTLPPAAPQLDLAASSDTAPVGDQATQLRWVSLVGQADPGQQVFVPILQDSVVANESGQFTIPGIELAVDRTTITVEALDDAGNRSSTQLQVTRESTSSDSVTLLDGDAFTSTQSITIPLAVVEGKRTVELDLGLSFGEQQDTQADDLFNVYLVDSAGVTLVDQGRIGTPLLSVSKNSTQLVPGVVQFDGRIATVDVTSAGVSEGDLRFEWINLDGVADARASISVLSNSIDRFTEPGAVGSNSFGYVVSGEPRDDLDDFFLTEALKVETRHSRADPETQRFITEVRIRNTGEPVGRRAIVALPELPNGVTLDSAVGVNATGEPYVDFSSAIAFGGLGHGMASNWVELSLSNPGNVPFEWNPKVYSAGQNASPTWQDMNPLQISVGQNVTLDLPVSDAEGEPLTISLRGSGGSPNVELLSGNQLRVNPRPGDEGNSRIELIASDGAASATTYLDINVSADTLQTTRLSGQVLDVDGTPLDEVPVQIGRHQATTDSTGTFQIEVPSFLVPTPHFDIDVPVGDPWFDPTGQGNRIIEMQRLGHLPGTGTSLNNPRLHPNLISAFLDASAVYGSDSARATALRTNDGSGRLKLGDDGLLPRNSSQFFPDGMLENENNSQRDPATMFVAGDVRSSENPGLASLHTILVREHNRRAEQLANDDPQLSGEELYQHARRWVSALMQHITYNEFLPVLLGGDGVSAYTGYDNTVNPQVSGLFSGAAFRIGHSMSPADVWRLAADGSDFGTGPVSLRDAFFNPDLLVSDGVEPYLRGMIEQPVEEIDTRVRDELRNFLFGPPGAGGLDLAAINIQRGRDMGLPSYNQARLDVGLAPVTTFAEITSDSDLQDALQSVYGSVDQIDVWLGGLAEDHIDGSMVGPLFAAILRDGFERLRDGDRFWYENGRLTESELAELRSTTLADVLERTSEISGITGSPFTTGSPDAGPEPGGNAADALPVETPSFNGSGNNPGNSNWGSAGTALLTDYTIGYDDGISEPGGVGRPSAREISNRLMSQTDSTTAASGATAMLMIWGQLIAHDMTLSASGMEDTLLVFGDARPGDVNYPFVPEKISDLLGHDADYGSANDMGRPIYLPKLSSAGVPIDPTQDTNVSVLIADGMPNVEVIVKAGTLRTREGELYDGPLSITPVPSIRTPAALPTNLQGSFVITVQPAGLVFTEPASITFPNFAELDAGTETEFWQVNPDTAQFEPVATMRVSEDGSVLQTIDGGLRTTSWGGPPPPPPSLNRSSGDLYNKDSVCKECEANAKTRSSVELHTGAYREWHDLVSYQSQGVSRGLRLTYNSLHADPRHTAHFQIQDVPDGLLWATGEASRGSRNSVETVEAASSYQRQGTPTLLDALPEGHYWNVPQRQDVLAGLVFDFSNNDSGLYVTDLDIGFGSVATGPPPCSGGGVCAGGNDVRQIVSQFAPFTIEGIETVVVNRRDSPFGAGWALEGLQQLIVHLSTERESHDGVPFESVVLLDGSEELVFRYEDGSFVSPPGDFSELIFDNSTERFTRTLKDGTEFRFDEQLRISQVEDRNGNNTSFEYRNGLIHKIIDPVGLETRFDSENGRVTRIIDPANRVTELQHDADGNLKRVTDPDNTSRRFSYDARHHLTQEINKRGDIETTVYNFLGRVEEVINPDGTKTEISSLQSQGVFPPELTNHYLPLVDAAVPPEPTVDIIDENGNRLSVATDRAGQLVSSTDGVGQNARVVRDENNLVTSVTDARGNVSQYKFDKLGNPISNADSFAGLNEGVQFFDRIIADPVAVDDRSGSAGTLTAAGDLNADGFEDFVALRYIGGTETKVNVHLAKGQGVFTPPVGFRIEGIPVQVELADFDSNGLLDLLVVNVDAGRSVFQIFNGLGDGTFRNASVMTVSDVIRYEDGVVAADLNTDGYVDLAYRGQDVANSEKVFVSMLGIGAFEFSPGSRVAIPNGRNDDSRDNVQLGDLDRDGDLDAVIANGGTNSSLGITVLHNDANGIFQIQSTLDVGVQGIWNGSSAGPSGISNLRLGDLNADGWLDIVAAGSASRGIYSILNDGAGGFLEPKHFLINPSRAHLPTTLEVLDANQDGMLDVVAFASRTISTGRNRGFERRMEILQGLGDGSFASGLFVGETTHIAHQTTKLDLLPGEQSAVLVSDSQPELTVEIISPNRRESSVVYQPSTISVPGVIDSALSDLDGDGELDLITLEESGDESVSIWSQSATPLGEERRLIQSIDLGSRFFGARHSRLLIDDFDNDGRDDIVAAIEQLGIYTLWSTEVLRQFEPADVVLGYFDRILDPVDFDGDGDLDLLTFETRFSRIRKVDNVGDRSFQAATLHAYQGAVIQEVAVGDANGDQVMDVVTIVSIGSWNSNDFFGHVHLLAGNGDGTVSPDSEMVLPYPGQRSDQWSLDVGNLDDDEANELVIASGYSTATRRSALMTLDWHDGGWLATPTFNRRVTGTFNLRFDGKVTMTDLNEDGNQDLVVTSISDEFAYLLGDGKGDFSSPTRLEPFVNPSNGFSPRVIIANAIGDQSMDFVVTHSGQVTFLQNFARSFSGASSVTEFESEFNLVTREVDELGRLTIYHRDEDTGNLLHEVRVVGSVDPVLRSDDDVVTSFTYTLSGMVNQITDPLGRVTRFDYDSLDRLTTMTYAVGTLDEVSMSYIYDPATVAGRAGLVTSMIDERGNVTEYQYDDLNRLTRIIEPDPDGEAGPLVSPETQMRYDAAGNLIQMVDAVGVTTETHYDSLDRVTRISDPSGTVRQRYDRAGNLIAVVDPLGNVTEYEYDARDRLVTMIDAEGGVTAYDYDFNDNLIALIDPVGNLTRFFYDERDRLIREIDPLGNPIRYEYDAVDNLISKTDRNGRVTQYAYDELDRMIHETWVDGDNEISYEYDKTGNLLAVDDVFSGLDFEYDALDRTTRVDNGDTPNAPHVVLDYTFDKSGNVIAVEDTIFDDLGNTTGGATTGYRYDALHRLVELTQSGADVSEKRVDFLYNQLGQYRQIDRFSDLAGTQPVVRTTYQYDDANRLIDLRHSNSTEDIAFYEYTYDTASRITSINSIDGLVEYRYDDTSQLVGADYSDPTRTDETYEYDENGNRLSSHLHSDGYVTGKANRLLSDGTYTYQYDKEGNQTRRTEIATGDYREFHWDHRNRLTAVIDKQVDGRIIQEVEFIYDALDRRIAKSVVKYAGSGVNEFVLYFIYDREDVVLDLITHSGMNDTSGYRVEKRYMHGAGTDEVFAQASVDLMANEWLLHNHVFSTIAIVDSQGTLETAIIYDGHGTRTTLDKEETATRYGLTGREHDVEVGHVFFRSRFYSSSQSRFISEDQIGFESGQSNIYVYPRLTPVNTTDPNGEFAPLIAMGVGMLINSALDYKSGRFDGLSGRCLAREIVGSLAVGGAAGLSAFFVPIPGIAGAVLGGAVSGVGSRALDVGLRENRLLSRNEFASSALLGGVGGAAGSLVSRFTVGLPSQIANSKLARNSSFFAWPPFGIAQSFAQSSFDEAYKAGFRAYLASAGIVAPATSGVVTGFLGSE